MCLSTCRLRSTREPYLYRQFIKLITTEIIAIYQTFNFSIWIHILTKLSRLFGMENGFLYSNLCCDTLMVWTAPAQVGLHVCAVWYESSFFIIHMFLVVSKQFMWGGKTDFTYRRTNAQADIGLLASDVSKLLLAWNRSFNIYAQYSVCFYQKITILTVDRRN